MNIKKILYALPLMAFSSIAFGSAYESGSKFVLPKSIQKDLVQKQILLEYPTIRKRAEEAIRAYDEGTPQDRRRVWIKELVDEAFGKVTDFKRKFKNNADSISDKAKRDEIEMNLEALQGRLLKIENNYHQLATTMAFNQASGE